MTKRKENQNFKLSFESDGKMGKYLKGKDKNKKEVEFFNTTPESE